MLIYNNLKFFKNNNYKIKYNSYNIKYNSYLFTFYVIIKLFFLKYNKINLIIIKFKTLTTKEYKLKRRLYTNLEVGRATACTAPLYA